MLQVDAAALLWGNAAPVLLQQALEGRRAGEEVVQPPWVFFFQLLQTGDVQLNRTALLACVNWLFIPHLHLCI